MSGRQWLTIDQKIEVKKIITKLFADGLTDRAIADTIRDRGFPGQWIPVRICQMRKIMGLKKGAALPPELRGAVAAKDLPPPEPENGVDLEPPLPRVQDVEYTFKDLIEKIEDLAKFARKVQDEFRRKGGAIFF